MDSLRKKVYFEESLVECLQISLNAYEEGGKLCWIINKGKHIHEWVGKEEKIIKIIKENGKQISNKMTANLKVKLFLRFQNFPHVSHLNIFGYFPFELFLVIKL